MTKDEVITTVDSFLKKAISRVKAGDSLEVVAYDIVSLFASIENNDYDPSLDSRFEKIFDLASYVELGPDYTEDFIGKSVELTSLLKKYA